MSFSIDNLFIREEGFGLLLGAGASFKAGYPLMKGLTEKTLKLLSQSETKGS